MPYYAQFTSGVVTAVVQTDEPLEVSATIVALPTFDLAVFGMTPAQLTARLAPP